MTRRAVIVVSALAVLAAAVVAGYLRLASESAPPVTFTTIDGRSTALADMRGQPVLVHFWATTCRVCRKEMPELTALYRDLQPRGLELIAVAMPYDPPNRVLKLARETPLPYPVALDVRGEAVRAFGNVDLTPTTFLIGPSGKIVFQHTGELDFEDIRGQIEDLL